jgi:hypothetical protein
MPDTRWMGGRVCLRAGSDAEKKTKMIGSTFHGTSARRPVAVPTESKMLRRIFWHKREEVKRSWRNECEICIGKPANYTYWGRSGGGGCSTAVRNLYFLCKYIFWSFPYVISLILLLLVTEYCYKALNSTDESTLVSVQQSKYDVSICGNKILRLTWAWPTVRPCSFMAITPAIIEVHMDR